MCENGANSMLADLQRGAVAANAAATSIYGVLFRMARLPGLSLSSYRHNSMCIGRTPLRSANVVTHDARASACSNVGFSPIEALKVVQRESVE